MSDHTTDRTIDHVTSTAGWRSVIAAACATAAAVFVVLQLGGCSCPASCDTCVASPYAADGTFTNDEVAGTVRLEPTMLSTADPVATRTSVFGDVTYTSAVARATGDTGADTNLTQVSFAVEGVDFDPDLSPDGEWMVFASTQHHEQPDLYRKSVGGQVVTQLTSDASQDAMPEISPDGGRIAFASNRNGNWDVFVMDAKGGPITQITFDQAEEIHPTWSPDGEKLCYCRHNKGNDRWELWTLEVQRPSVRSFVCEGLFPRWSPDEDRDRILFQRSRKRGERLYGIWTIDLVDGDGLNPTEIVAAGRSATMHPTWSASGDRIAYTRVVEPSFRVEGMPVWSDICTIGVDGSAQTTLAAGGFRNLRPTWGSDDRVFFMSNRSGQNVIWSVSAGAPVSSYETIATDDSVDGPSESDAYATVAPMSEFE